MIHPALERRVGKHPSQGIEFDALTVRRGIVVQYEANTTSAVEYLKARDVAARVIARVLSGDAVRHEDRQALSPGAAPAQPA